MKKLLLTFVAVSFSQFAMAQSTYDCKIEVCTDKKCEGSTAGFLKVEVSPTAKLSFSIADLNLKLDLIGSADSQELDMVRVVATDLTTKVSEGGLIAGDSVGSMLNPNNASPVLVSCEKK